MAEAPGNVQDEHQSAMLLDQGTSLKAPALGGDPFSRACPGGRISIGRAIARAQFKQATCLLRRAWSDNHRRRVEIVFGAR